MSARPQPSIRVTQHQSYNFQYSEKTTVMQLKEDAAERFTKLNGRKIYADNLDLCFYKFGEIYEQYNDDDLLDAIEIEKTGKYVLIEIRMEQYDGDYQTKKSLEINFSRAYIGSTG